MALFLLYASKPGDRNSGQFNSVLVEAATEQDARDTAMANRPNGEARVRDSWAALNLGAGEFPVQTPPRNASRSVCWFQGRGPVSLLGLDSGGNPMRDDAS